MTIFGTIRKTELGGECNRVFICFFFIKRHSVDASKYTMFRVLLWFTTNRRTAKDSELPIEYQN